MMFLWAILLVTVFALLLDVLALRTSHWWPVPREFYLFNAILKALTVAGVIFLLAGDRI